MVLNRGGPTRRDREVVSELESGDRVVRSPVGDYTGVSAVHVSDLPKHRLVSGDERYSPKTGMRAYRYHTCVEPARFGVAFVGARSPAGRLPAHLADRLLR